MFPVVRFDSWVRVLPSPSVPKPSKAKDGVEKALTDEVYGLLEVGADVSEVAVLHRDPFVTEAASGVLSVPAGDVEQGCDLEITQVVLPGSVVGTAEVQERQDLYWFSLGTKKSKRFVKNCEIGPKLYLIKTCEKSHGT